MTAASGMIPNYTTAGRHFTRDILTATAEYCGAVAISHDPVRMHPTPGELHRPGEELAGAGIKANVHYVLSRWSLPRAIELAEGRHDTLYEPFNAILFLSYKPAGRAAPDGVLQPGRELSRFVELLAAADRHTGLRLGVDACLAPLLLRRGVPEPACLDSCEAGFFSIFIDEELNVMPCSFCTEKAYAFSLRDYSLKEIWEEKFRPYRALASATCARRPDCGAGCRGACPFYSEVARCSCSTPRENPL